VAFFAVRLAVVFGETSTSQRVHAERAHKVFRVPLLVQSVDAPSSDRFAASRAQTSRLLVVVGLAVRFPAHFEETSSSKRFLTVGAHEVLRVPLRAKSIDAVSPYGFSARGALGSEESVEIGFTVGFSISVVEIRSAEWFETLGANKVVHVPLFSNCGDASI
jgi:hypothetical protein